jgi:hypothetical protein
MLGLVGVGRGWVACMCVGIEVWVGWVVVWFGGKESGSGRQR